MLSPPQQEETGYHPEEHQQAAKNYEKPAACRQNINQPVTAGEQTESRPGHYGRRNKPDVVPEVNESLAEVHVLAFQQLRGGLDSMPSPDIFPAEVSNVVDLLVVDG